MIEEIQINVFGSTVAIAYDNLQVLNNLLDEAERWFARRESLNPVTLRFAPQGSTLASTAAPLQRLILGRAPGNQTEGALRLSQRFTDAGMIVWILQVRIRIWVRGQWLLDTETSTSASANPGAIMSATSLSVTLAGYSPTDITLAGFGAGGGLAIPASFLLINQSTTPASPSTQGLGVTEAETMTAATYTSVADAANLARGGSVLRYTPVGTSYAISGNGALPASLDSPLRFDIFAVVRNNSAATSWQIYSSILNNGGVQINFTTPVLIDGTSLLPQVVWLGTFSSRRSPSAFRLHCKASQIAGGPTLDIDYIAFIAKDRQPAMVLALDATTGPAAGVTGDQKIVVSHKMLTDRTGELTLQDSNVAPVITPATGRGAIECFTKSQYVNGLWLCTLSNYWRYAPAGALPSLTMTATRQKGYLTPQ